MSMTAHTSQPVQRDGALLHSNGWPEVPTTATSAYATALPGNPPINGSYISGDGSVIVGFTTNAPVSAVRWVAGSPPTLAYLPVLGNPPASFHSSVFGLSRDGHVAIGWDADPATNFLGDQAVRWIDGKSNPGTGDPVWLRRLTCTRNQCRRQRHRRRTRFRRDLRRQLHLGFDKRNARVSVLSHWPWRRSDWLDQATLQTSQIAAQQIAGYGLYNGREEGFVVTVPEPITLSLTVLF